MRTTNIGFQDQEMDGEGLFSFSLSILILRVLSAPN